MLQLHNGRHDLVKRLLTNTEKFDEFSGILTLTVYKRPCSFVFARSTCYRYETVAVADKTALDCQFRDVVDE